MGKVLIMIIISALSRIWQYINKPPKIDVPPLDETLPNLCVVESTDYILEKEIIPVPNEGTDAYLIYLDMPTICRSSRIQFGTRGGIYYEWVNGKWVELPGVIGVLYKQPTKK